MARIRTIKPEFFTSENIVAMSALARLLYIALWCEADKEGRMTWKPRTFKMRYLPADDCAIEPLCDELVKSGMVVLYGDGLAYIPGFTKHQHVNPRETASVLPSPPDYVPDDPKRISADLRSEIMDRDGNKCTRCNATEDLTLDHILPQCAGGKHVAGNLRVMCRKCNAGRPVSGKGLIEDLAIDGFSLEELRANFGIDASLRVVTRANLDQHAQVGREGKGRERKEGKEHIPDAAFAAPASKSPGSLAFDEFDDAYRTRYGNSYTRNAKVNRHFSDLCKRLGSEEAPKVARWYVESENLPEFIKASHDPALLLMRCESIRTRMLQNRPMTTREAVDIDRRSGDEITIRNAVDKAQGLTRLPIQAEYQRLPEAIL